jgi:putative ubiquitin-RnfH superfamily antitoxin RatB of RatAB toxin-antitoxin module
MERNHTMYEKKQNIFKSPDLAKLQEVLIDHRTKIYIALGADPEEAKRRYVERFGAKKV